LQRVDWILYGSFCTSPAELITAIIFFELAQIYKMCQGINPAAMKDWQRISLLIREEELKDFFP